MPKRKRKGHIAGRKFYGKHTTVTDAAQQVARYAEKFPEVTKITLGEIKRSGNGNGTLQIKFFPIHGGWTVVAQGSRAKQNLHIYSDEPGKTKDELEKRFMSSS